MANTLGHDLSKYQGNINFDAYKNQGKSQFAIIKSSEGIGYKDPTFSQNQQNLRSRGILTGYYHFARPDLGNTAEKEAEFFLSVIGKLQSGELVTLDYECPNQIQDHVTWCKKWLDYVYNKTGVKPLIYLNQSIIKKFDWKIVVDAGYGLWIAAYTYDPNKNDFDKGEWEFAAMQQWTNKQIVSGIQGVVDGNVFFGDLGTLKKYGYQGANPTPEPVPAPIDSDIEKLFKKKLSDKNWNILQEFEKLRIIGLIDREDSIQTQLIKLLNYYAELQGKLDSVQSKYVEAQNKLDAIRDILS
jgi:lysozyme